jgi:hypothetical protein
MACQDAIAFIQSSFVSSQTHTVFASPAVDIDQTTPAPILDIIRQKGQLIVPAVTELRMRYWHLLHPQMLIPDLLVHSLAKGLPYRITMPLTSLSNTSFPAPQQSIGHIPQGRNVKVSPRMVNVYLSNVQLVLSRPHAHKFLKCGGLIWRIVRQYRPEIYTRAFVVPNSSHDEIITPGEIQTLVGVTSNNNSFWPYPEWYENSSRYNGEWSAANEAWFISHARNIQYAREGSLRGGRAWQRTIHVHTAAHGSNPAVSGTMAHAQACCSQLVGQWPELWEGFDITRLE